MPETPVIDATLAALRPYQNLIILTLALTLPLILFTGLRGWLGAWAADKRLLGRIGLTLFLLITSSGHFASADQMQAMLPNWAPFRLLIIYATGLLELGLAALLWLGGTRRLAGAGIAAILLLFLPANIYAAMNSLPFGGNEMGPNYLFLRVPYQFALIWWALWSSGWIGEGAGRHAALRP